MKAKINARPIRPQPASLECGGMYWIEDFLCICAKVDDEKWTIVVLNDGNRWCKLFDSLGALLSYITIGGYALTPANVRIENA